jgi:hypothetical protein
MLADEWEMRCQRHGKVVTACFRPAGADSRDDPLGGDRAPEDGTREGL